MTDQTGYDATRDPRTGRPVLPLDAENARKADAESEPLTEEDNLGIAIEDEDEADEIPGVGDEDDLPLPISVQNEEIGIHSAEEINSTVPRMKGPDIETEDSKEDLIDRNV